MILDFNVLIITFSFILLDIISGVAQAVKNKTLSSQIMREGIYHKLGYVLIIVLSALIEYGVIYIDLGFETPLFIPVCVMICLTEILSIIENIERINPMLANSGIFTLLSQNKKRRNDDDD